jgi:hypothetical protein
VSGRAGKSAIAALGMGERLTIRRPRTAGALLQEASAASASRAAGVGTKDGVPRAASVAGMEWRHGSSGSGSAAASADNVATCCVEGRKEAEEGMLELIDCSIGVGGQHAGK